MTASYFQPADALWARRDADVHVVAPREDKVCGPIALALATSTPLLDVLRDLRRLGRKRGQPTRLTAIAGWLQVRGWRRTTYQTPRPTLEQWLLTDGADGRWVLIVHGHAAAAIGGMLCDPRPPRWNGRVYVAWRDRA